MLTVSALAAAVGLLAGPGASPAYADPPLSVAEAKAQVEQLEVEAAAIDQQYVGVREELKEGQQALALKQTDVKSQTAKVGRMRVQVGRVALAKFQNRNLDTAAQLFFTEDTDDFLSQISTVEKVSENQNTTLQDFQAQQAKLADLHRSSETDVAALEAKREQLTKLRAASIKKIEDSKRILAKLTKEEQERIAAEERKARAAALAAAKAAEESAARESTRGSAAADSSRSNSNSSASNSSASNSSQSSSSKSSSSKSSSSRSSGGDSTTTSSSGNSRGERVVAFAKRQLGKAYRFAAEGPDAYDCSGLVLAAYKSVGVSMPRLADDQLEVGRKISRSELRPGDLIGYYSPTSHIAIYIGDGKIIDAPNPRKSVRMTTVDYMPYNFASRPVG